MSQKLSQCFQQWPHLNQTVLINYLQRLITCWYLNYRSKFKDNTVTLKYVNLIYLVYLVLSILNYTYIILIGNESVIATSWFYIAAFKLLKNAPMTLKFQTKTTLATSQTAVDGVSVGMPIHSTQPNYTLNLKEADGVCTWQQEQIWLSSSSAQEVNMLQKCETRQQLSPCCWTAHIRGMAKERKNILQMHFFPWYFSSRGMKNRLLWEVKWGVKVLKLGVVNRQ